ncbi:hypothetical protein WME76_24765 [Sorangium sp. So ce119]|uniref:hypothetical protein n=1 Tax=Sorangium sp. So ce119 TaxID=3133279 RepID=UPI003F61CBF1
MNGFDAVLRVSDPLTWGDVPWRVEAHGRVRTHVLPALAGTGAYLRALLVHTQEQGGLALGPDSGSHLGFNPLGEAAAPIVTILFDGQVPAASEGSGSSAEILGVATPRAR